MVIGAQHRASCGRGLVILGVGVGVGVGQWQRNGGVLDHRDGKTRPVIAGHGRGRGLGSPRQGHERAEDADRQNGAPPDRATGEPHAVLLQPSPRPFVRPSAWNTRESYETPPKMAKG